MRRGSSIKAVLAAYPDEAEEYANLQERAHRQAEMLGRIVEIIRGPAPPHGLWSTHDAVDLVSMQAVDQTILVQITTMLISTDPLREIHRSAAKYLLDQVLRRQAELADFSHVG